MITACAVPSLACKANAAPISDRTNNPAAWIATSRSVARTRLAMPACRNSTRTASPVTTGAPRYPTCSVTRLVCPVDIDAFVGTHRDEWARLETLVRRATRASRLRGDEVDELVRLYRRAATH